MKTLVPTEFSISYLLPRHWPARLFHYQDREHLVSRNSVEPAHSEPGNQKHDIQQVGSTVFHFLGFSIALILGSMGLN